MKEKQYIQDSDFRKLTKKQKLAIPEYCTYDEEKIEKLVIVPINKKSSGYFLGSFFAYTPDKGWWRPMTYDSWSIRTEIENPAKIKYQILRGDFENGGMQIFCFIDEHHEAFMGYGGDIIIRGKLPPTTTN